MKAETVLTAKTTSVLLTIIVLLAACSGPTTPKKLADITSSLHGGAFYLYVPGSIRDDYITLETGPKNAQISLIAFTKCSFVAAKFVGGSLELTLFQADFHVKSMDYSQRTDVPGFDLQISAFNRAPNEAEVNNLKQDGFSILKCDFPR